MSSNKDVYGRNRSIYDVINITPNRGDVEPGTIHHWSHYGAMSFIYKELEIGIVWIQSLFPIIKWLVLDVALSRKLGHNKKRPK